MLNPRSRQQSSPQCEPLDNARDLLPLALPVAEGPSTPEELELDAMLPTNVKTPAVTARDDGTYEDQDSDSGEDQDSDPGEGQDSDPAEGQGDEGNDETSTPDTKRATYGPSSY